MSDVKVQSKDEKVKVFIRLRPLQNSDHASDISISNDDTIIFPKSSMSRELKTFKFNRVFGEICSQIDVYQVVASPLVDQALRGYNGTIFAYGQSGTGKTYTMLGDTSQKELRGIVPNVFSHIFAEISLADQRTSYAITITFLEIYNEEVRDLLDNSRKKLEVRENPDIGVYVKGLSGIAVESSDQVMDIISMGSKRRSLGSTKLNDQSSRSHAIFTVLVEAKHEDGSTSVGKLNLVDLAGSERVSKSFAEGDRLKEAGKINLSLSVLGNVISALIDGKSSHVPYRNSKLTRLLQDSLGGSCLTSMIATISSNREFLEESFFTLMYADRVKHITNRVRKNQENKSLLKCFESKIEALRKELNELSSHQPASTKERKIRKTPDISIMKTIQKEKDELLVKIATIQRKILVGGENLLEKAQIQYELLEHRAKELKMLDSSHQILEKIFEGKKAEKRDFERKSISLQEEDKLLDAQIEEMEGRIAKAEEVLLKKENEYQNEIGSLLYANKCLAKDMGLVDYVVATSIPREDLVKIRENVIWDEDSQEYRLKFVPYCGNNLKKISKEVGRGPKVNFNRKHVYRKYWGEF